jgi:hypothetical protein
MDRSVRSRTSKNSVKHLEHDIFSADPDDGADDASSRYEGDDHLEEFRSDEACAALPNGKPPIRDQFDLMAGPLPVKFGGDGDYPQVYSPPPNYQDNLAFQGDEPGVKVVTRDNWVKAVDKVKFVSRRRVGLTVKTTTTTGTIDEIDRLQAEEQDNNSKTFLWKDAFYDYTQSTTYHGIRLVFEDQPFFFRRYNVKKVLYKYIDL